MLKELDPFLLRIQLHVEGNSSQRSVCGSRSEKPGADSYYQGIMPRIWEISKMMAEKGISCERAAEDIARAMAKPRPPRFVRTGDNPLLFLFGELCY